MIVLRRCATGYDKPKAQKSNAQLTGNEQRARKLLSDGTLDLGIGLEVDTTRGFVHNDNGGSPQECTSERDELPLPL
jgi:hypothetical protein